MTFSSAKSKSKYFSLADLLVVAVILVAAVAGFAALFFSSSDDALTAVISVRGEEYCEIDLANVDKPYDLTITGDEDVVLSIAHEGVRFKTSDCPDKLCVNTGLLSRGGQSAVCLPARVSVKLVSTDSHGQPDAVVG